MHHSPHERPHWPELSSSCIVKMVKQRKTDEGELQASNESTETQKTNEPQTSTHIPTMSWKANSLKANQALQFQSPQLCKCMAASSILQRVTIRMWGWAGQQTGQWYRSYPFHFKPYQWNYSQPIVAMFQDCAITLFCFIRRVKSPL